MDFCKDWKFSKEGQPEQNVCLPHDAMLWEKREFGCHNGKQSGYFPGGIYRYEKKFVLSGEECKKTVKILFEAVYQNCKIYCNHELVGEHKYGYTEFYVDLTGKVREGENILLVIADNSLEPNCRWYSGSGIFRPVHLIIKGENAPEKLRIRTVSYDPAIIEVEAEETAKIEIYDGLTKIAEGMAGQYTIKNAKLWSAETPFLYTCIARIGKEAKKVRFGVRTLAWNAQEGLTVNGRRVLLRGGCIHHDNGVLGACGFADAEERRVRILKEAGYNAIRSAHNPMTRAMLAACDRIGMYVMDEAFDGWYTPKNYHDYSRYFETEWKHDLQAMVDKDYNHPCVIMYSIGNEVSETASQKGVETCGMLAEYVRNADNTRPVTCGINVLLNVYTNLGFGVYKDKGNYEPKPLPPKTKNYKEKKTGSAFFNAMAQKLGGLMFFMSSGRKGDKACAGAAEKLDILGLNYAGSRFQADLKKYPKRMMVASETMVTDLPYNWPFVKKYPAVIGDFVWAAWDYLGEAGVGDWMYHSYQGLPLLAGSGTIDITGKITAEAYYEQIIWKLRKKPFIGVQPLNHQGEVPQKSAWRFTNAIDSWTWHGYEGKKTIVEVYANAASVCLECNGKVIGRKAVKKYKAEFSCVYEPGKITAIALDAEGKEQSRHTLKTGGKETVLQVLPEKTELLADGQSLCFLPIQFTDKNGDLKPYVEEEVEIKIEGTASLQGFGSALAKTDERYTDHVHTSYRGRLLAVVRAGYEPGNATVTVSAKNMKPVTVKIKVCQLYDEEE